jgi:hypothetical protein
VFRSNAPNPFLTEAPYLFAKWGQPKLVEQYGPTEYWYRCGNCNATWVGPNADYCDWCYQRWLWRTHTARQSLLFPEWLYWDARYFVMSKLDQAVWEQTRGFADGFETSWAIRLQKAKQNAEITSAEFDAATNRYAEWIKRNPSPI